MYDKLDDFEFDIVNLSFWTAMSLGLKFTILDGGISWSPSYVVHLSLSLFVSLEYYLMFRTNNRNKVLIAKLLKQGYRNHKL